MLRMLTDVSNINYWLRCQGDRLEPATAERFDEDLRAGMQTALGGHLPQRSKWQAELAVQDGGLGLRSASQMAPLAFISSRVTSRPMVIDLFRRAQHCGIGDVEEYMRLYDDRTNACILQLATTWGRDIAEEVQRVAIEGEGRAHLKWRRDAYGDKPEGEHDQDEGAHPDGAEPPVVPQDCPFPLRYETSPL